MLNPKWFSTISAPLKHILDVIIDTHNLQPCVPPHPRFHSIESQLWSVVWNCTTPKMRCNMDTALQLDRGVSTLHWTQSEVKCPTMEYCAMDYCTTHCTMFDVWCFFVKHAKCQVAMSRSSFFLVTSLCLSRFGFDLDFCVCSGWLGGWIFGWFRVRVCVISSSKS